MTPKPSIERTSPGKPGLASHVKRYDSWPPPSNSTAVRLTI